MGFGDNAQVIASHGLMVMINALVCWRLMRLLGSRRPKTSEWTFPAAIVMYVFALNVERLYYVVARIMPDWDLWGQHPAPAALSAIVAASGYWFMAPIFQASGIDKRTAIRRSSIELAWFAVLWIVLSLGLQ